MKFWMHKNENTKLLAKQFFFTFFQCPTKVSHILDHALIVKSEKKSDNIFFNDLKRIVKYIRYI